MTTARAEQSRAGVAQLANAYDQLMVEADKIEKALDKAMATAYRRGVSAIELAKITGLTRTNVYDRLKRVGKYEPQQPKKEEEEVEA